MSSPEVIDYKEWVRHQNAQIRRAVVLINKWSRLTNIERLCALELREALFGEGVSDERRQ